MPPTSNIELDLSELDLSEGDFQEIAEISRIYRAQLPPEEASKLSNDELFLGQSLLSCFMRFKDERSSKNAFTLEQWKWRYMAGHHSLYWRMGEPGWCTALHVEPPDRLYIPLDRNKRHIRVLKVTCTWPEPSKQFYFTLIPVSLDDDVPYLAVSYTWGDPTVVSRISCEQGALELTQSVHTVLETLVGLSDTLYLWIDALCINQNDLDEKAYQVGFMGDIYRKAQQVIVCLGEPDDSIPLAMDFLHRVPQAFDKLEEARSSITASNVLAESGYGTDALRALGSLLRRRWFTRFWVVQEVALGCKPIVVCGEHAIQWEVLEGACARINLHSAAFSAILVAATADVQQIRPKEPSFSALGLATVGNIGSFRGSAQNHKPPAPFQESLMLFGDFDATDPRDRIFAVLGLVNDATDKALAPDYKVSVEELYRRTTSYPLARDLKIMLLARAGIGFSRALSHLPSWVPDWTSTPKCRTFFYLAWSSGYEASGDTKPNIQEDRNNPLVLKIEGVKIDKISQISSLRLRMLDETECDDFEESIGFYFKRTLAWLEEVEEMVASTASCAEVSVGGNWKESMWMTLVSNGNPHASVDPGKFATELGFESWRKDVEMAALKGIFSSSLEGEAEKEANFYESACTYAASRHRFFITSKGYMGLTSPGTEIGDTIVSSWGGGRLS